MCNSISFRSVKSEKCLFNPYSSTKLWLVVTFNVYKVILMLKKFKIKENIFLLIKIKKYI